MCVYIYVVIFPFQIRLHQVPDHWANSVCYHRHLAQESEAGGFCGT